VREVEGHHESYHEPSSRANTGLVVDPVQSHSPFASTTAAFGQQRCTAKPLVTSKVRFRKIR
jgi:hypothetical protein